MNIFDDIKFDVDFTKDKNAQMIMNRLKSMFYTADETPTDLKIIMKNIGVYYDKGDRDSLQKIIDYLSDSYNMFDLITNHDVGNKFIVKLWKNVLLKAKNNNIKLSIPSSVNTMLQQNNLLELL